MKNRITDVYLTYYNGQFTLSIRRAETTTERTMDWSRADIVAYWLNNQVRAGEWECKPIVLVYGIEIHYWRK